MAYQDSNSFGIIEGLNVVFGAAVNIPTNFFKSGVANIYEGYFGQSTGLDFAALNVGPNPTTPLSMSLKGLSNFSGLHTQTGGFVCKGMVNLIGSSFSSDCVSTTFKSKSFSVSSASGNKFVSAKSNTIVSPTTSIQSKITSIRGQVFIDGLGNLAATVNSKKGFDIPHPNNPNHRLRHICVEGPESAVYVRGKLVNNNIIDLPDYWSGLVDPETITVNLTQIGHSQDLIVEKIEWGKRIVVKSGNGTSINCYYQVWADRLGEKLIPEYEGITPNDYPGDNSEYSIAGWDYDNRLAK